MDPTASKSGEVDLEDALTRALQATAQSASLRGLRAAARAALVGDAEGVRSVLAGLGDRERWLALMAIGRWFPDTTLGAVTDLASWPARVPSWGGFCDPALVLAWARAMDGHLDDPSRIATLARDSDWAGRVLLALVDDLAPRDLARAEAHAAAIPTLDRDHAGASYARIAIEVWRRGGDEESMIELAIHAASAPPFVEDGGAEVEALAVVIGALTSMPPERGPAMVVRALTRLARQLVHQHRDTRSWGLARAVEACAGAATPEQPAWITHAETLAATIYRDEFQAAARQAIHEAKIACGLPSDAPPVRAEAPPPLVLRSEPPTWTQRARALSAQLATEDRFEAAIEALAELFTPEIEPESAAERIEWASALSTGGAQTEAQGELISLVSTHEEKFDHWFPEVCDVAVAVLGEDGVVPFVRLAIERGLATATDTRWNRAIPASSPLAVLVRRAADADLERQTTQAVCASLPWDPSNRYDQHRFDRLAAWFDGLDRHGGLDLEQASAVLGEERYVLAVIAARRGLGLADILQRFGPVPPGRTWPLLAEVVAAGRADEALPYIVDAVEPRERLYAWRAVVEDPRTPAEVARRIATEWVDHPPEDYGSGEGAHWLDGRARAWLAAGEVDAALEVLGHMSDCRYHTRGPAYVALAVARWLDAHPGTWNEARARALLSGLARGHAQETCRVLLETMERVFRAGIDEASVEPALEQVAQTFFGDGDRGLLALGRSVGRSHRGVDVQQEVGEALALAAQPWGHTTAARLVIGVRRAGPTARRWLSSAVLRLRDHNAQYHLASDLQAAFARPGPDELPGLYAGVTLIESERIRETAIDALVSAVAAEGTAGAEPVLADAIVRSLDVNVARRRGRSMARWAARVGRLDAAKRLAGRVTWRPLS